MKSVIKQKGFTIVELFYALFVLAIIIGGIGGWVWNIVKIFHADFTHVTGVLVLRCIGIFVAPLGAVLGWC